MTTAVPSSERPAVAERPLRLLPIAANLLPPEIVEARRARKMRRIVVSAVAAFAVLLSVWHSTARYQTGAAREEMITTQDDVQDLEQQQRAFDELINAQAESRTIRTQLAALLADDLQWSRLLSALQAEAPNGVQVTGVSGSLTTRVNGVPVATGGGAQLPHPAGGKQIGTMTVTGRATGKTVVAEYVDRLARIPGLANPLLGDVALQDDAVRFTVRLNIMNSALGGRYTPKSSAAPKGK